MKRVIISADNQDINTMEPICAMSIINPRLCRQKSIQIEVEQRDEGPIPHLHVYLDKTRNPKNCAYIRLDKAEYAPHHDSIRMNKKQKREFLDVMKSLTPNSFTLSRSTGEGKQANGYQTAAEIWIETFGETVQFQYDDEGYLIMPDYESL